MMQLASHTARALRRQPHQHAAAGVAHQHRRRLTTPARAGASQQPAAPAAAAAGSTEVEKLLESFWEARGVFDLEQRQQLVQVAKSLPAALGESSSDDEDGAFLSPGSTNAAGLQEGAPLPGIPTTWAVNQSVPEIHAVSKRLVQLHSLLGAGGDIDVIWMVTREPALLTASKHQLMSRLMAMKLATVGCSVDVVKVVERQPSLLLLDDASPVGDWSQLDPEELQEQLTAWECGVGSDTDPEWRRRADELRAYHRQHGDTSVGFRDGDDQELARWANKQRRAMAAGSLPEDKLELLEQLRFEADEDDAEWLRWFLELARFKEQQGHASPASMSAGADLYLINWCAVQRVAKRCNVLSGRRLGLLDGIEFDWAGADPLS